MAATQARRAIVTLASLLAAWPAVGAAANESLTASLAVTGPPDCAGRAELVRRVVRRSARIRFDDGSATGPALRVVVKAASPGAVVASLSFAWPGGTQSERQLTAPSCAEAADAIALVVVLALDPTAVANRQPAPAPVRSDSAPPARPRRLVEPRVAGAPPLPVQAPPAPAAPSSPALPPAPAEDTQAPPASPERPPPPPPAPIEPAIVASPPAAVEPAPPPQSRINIGAAVRFASGPAPALMPGLALLAAWQRDTESVLSWKVQLLAARHLRDWTTSDGTADFTLDLVALHVCPLRLGVPNANARLCGAASGGRLIAAGADVLSAHTRSRPFAGVGAAALFAFSPHPRLELAASVEPQVPLIRDQFSFGPNIFYRVPSMVLLFGLGATVTFH